MSSYKYTKMSTMSAIAISSGYLRRQPLPRLGYSSCGRDSIGGCTVLLISDSWGFRSISRSDSSDSSRKYSLRTVNKKDINPFNNLTVHISPLTISRLYSPSQCPAWPVFPSLHTKTGEFGSKSYTTSVLGLLHIFKASTI